MRILAIDIGKGTTDILVYDSEHDIENCHKLVVPSGTTKVAAAISRATEERRAVVFEGVTMGGGPSGRALRRHLEAGLPFICSPPAALTFNDDLEKVASWGVEITEQPRDQAPGDSTFIQSGDVDVAVLMETFVALGINTEFDGVAVAVQDHGFTTETSNRRFRFQFWRQQLEVSARWESLAYPGESIPPPFSRMRSVISLFGEFDRTLVMDTGPAAILGGVLDVSAEEGEAAGKMMVANIGNGHTLVAIAGHDHLEALVEHHTSLMDEKGFTQLVRSFAAAELTDEQVFESGGHGCIPPAAAMGFDRPIIVTGPRRDKVKDSHLPFVFAAPFGDMMMSGCFGLVEAWRRVNADHAS